MRKIKTGSDFSGVGAFDYAIDDVAKEKGFKIENVFACDLDKFARQSYLANHSAPGYYPEDVYDREIPSEPLDIYMTSPPCQSFSLAGKRKGKKDKRGILFFNSHEFIQKNKPRYFIFENVKGLLSDDKANKEDQYGKTFREWVNMLGGKSVNGNPVIFPYESAVPYHIYYKVLNAKHHGIPQNRERVFIIGIRDDSDNHFTWPKDEYLEIKLKNVLETEVGEKYFLSNKMLAGLMRERDDNFKGKFEALIGDEEHAKCITTKAGQHKTDNFIKVGFINQDTQGGQVFSEDGVSPTISAGTHGYANGFVEIAKIERTDEAKKTRKNNLAKGKDFTPFQAKKLSFVESDIMNTITTQVTKDNLMKINFRIRRLTPRECFRLMDFPEDHKFIVSDTQLYKQAGNSIVRKVLRKILNNLKL